MMGVAARRSAANRGVLPLGRRRRLLTEVFRISPGSVQDEPRIETNTDATGKRKKEGKGERDLGRFSIASISRSCFIYLFISGSCLVVDVVRCLFLSLSLFFFFCFNGSKRVGCPSATRTHSQIVDKLICVRTFTFPLAPPS